MIEVFKTDIKKISQANKLVALLQARFPGTRINVDLHDCDKILRIEGPHFSVAGIVMLVTAHGFACTCLE